MRAISIVRSARVALIGLLILAGTTVVLSCSKSVSEKMEEVRQNDSQPSEVLPSSPRFQVTYGAKYHTLRGAPACRDADHYYEFWRYGSVGDTVMMRRMIAEGHCQRLPMGMVVVAEEFAGGDWNGDLIRVRKMGTRVKLVLEAPRALVELADDPDWQRRDARRR